MKTTLARSLLRSFSASLALALTGPLSAQVVGVQELSASTTSVLSGLDDGDQFGRSAALLGDLDGDGVVDAAVGTPLDDDGGPDRGAVHVLFLRADGSVREVQKISATSGGFAGQLDDLDLFGWSLACLGDLDGDLVPDLAVGAKKDDDGDTNRGAVWILFLNPDGTVKSHAKISSTAGGFGGSIGRLDTFGSSLAAIGDLDGDGVVDLAVGADQDDQGGVDSGAVWILFLNSDGSVHDELRISSNDMGFMVTLDSLDRFGSSVTGLGDLDGDDVPDLAVGADADDDGGNNRGAVYLLFLRPDGTVRSNRKISALDPSFSGVLADKDRFGSALASLGDLEGDGFFELAVGAPYDDDGGPDRGAVWILSLDRGGAPVHQRKISSGRGNFTGQLADGNLFGTAIVSMRDLDMDGTDDMLVGSAGDDGGGPDRGATFVSFLGQLARSRFSNGQGINSVCLAPQNLAVLGQDWRLTVTTFQHAGASSSFVIGFDQPLGGIFLPAGEILVDPNSNLIFVSVLPVSGAATTHVVPVANDPVLIGMPFHAQGGILGGSLELCNGIDFCAGY